MRFLTLLPLAPLALAEENWGHRDVPRGRASPATSRHATPNSAGDPPAPGGAPTGSKPPFFCLAGDSTTAAGDELGSGWGNGFLHTLVASAAGQNLGHPGSTTTNYYDNSVGTPSWADLIKCIESNKEKHKVHATLSWAHNEEKLVEGKAVVPTSLYKQHLTTMIAEVQAAGAEPVLVTSLTRRKFVGNELVVDGLVNYAKALMEVAQQTGRPYVDLHAASRAYVAGIGPEASHTYNRLPDDNTHLNPHGSDVFGGGIVAPGILHDLPELASYIHLNHTLLALIAAKKPA